MVYLRTYEGTIEGTNNEGTFYTPFTSFDAKVDSKLLQTTKHLKSLRSKSITLKIKLPSYLRTFVRTFFRTNKGRLLIPS